MATCKKAQSGEFSGMNDSVRRASIRVLLALKGKKIDKLKVAKDCLGNWKNADPDKRYAGLVPVIGGRERYDLAQLSGDLTNEVTAYPDGYNKPSRDMLPDEPLHREAVAYLDAHADDGEDTYQKWYDFLAEKFGGGDYEVDPFIYKGKNHKTGKEYTGGTFGVKKIEPTA